MAKNDKQPSFDEILTALRGYKFDVGPAGSVANASPSAGLMQVAKYGCAAVVGPNSLSGKVGRSGPATALGRAKASGKAPSRGDQEPAVAIVGRAGIVVGGEIAHILDRGYQKFLKTAHAEQPATAEHLRALHRFSEELRQVTGNISLYNESLGTVSDEYVYDRVKGRNLPESDRPTPAWELPVSVGTPGEVE